VADQVVLVELGEAVRGVEGFFIADAELRFG
jgi:hypothetical protein